MKIDGSHYDYTNQAWTVDGIYQNCGHPESNCGCYGKAHAGELADSANLPTVEVETPAALEVKGVRIGDVFMNGKYLKAVVVDFLEMHSMVTGKVVDYRCIAQGLGLARNRFETNFVTVARNRVSRA